MMRVKGARSSKRRVEGQKAFAGVCVWLGVAVCQACTPPAAATLAQLQARAAFDLGCPPPELYVYAFDQRTRGVVGCGQRVTYVEDCSVPGRACTWIADSPWSRQIAVTPPGSGGGQSQGATTSEPANLPWPPAPNPYDSRTLSPNPYGSPPDARAGTPGRPNPYLPSTSDGAAGQNAPVPSTGVMPAVGRREDDLGF
jgi:hypothetical protein